MLMDRDAFVVPLKRFDVAKARLRSGGAREVSALARNLATNVLRHCAPRHVIVLSESVDITRFAHDQGAEVMESDAANLNDAAQRAYSLLADRFDRLIFVHGDLRNPEGLADFRPSPGVTIVTDHHGTGTNVLVVPTGLDFQFAYGAGSAQLHEQEARRLCEICHIIVDSPWRFDVDEPGDLT
jgi:2-phospho-L-lactate guanylyltransferase (CobY/MobA/RfbA family)